MYRLDHTWHLHCWFRNEGNVLIKATLEERTRHIWIAPPADFTGTWIVYFVNGQPSHEIEYRDGKYHGKFTANHTTGAKSVVQHYGPDGADGEDTGYYPSGKVSYRAHYSKGQPIGVWTWYNEQGEVTSTKVH
jgi:antitoxin component YwqK of YwqJK toxin-antitoxin module